MSLYANYDMAEKAETMAIKYAIENGPIEFDGMNCNDYKDDDQPDCGGWDGESCRCECGNRRVGWDIEKNPDGSFAAYARAY